MAKTTKKTNKTPRTTKTAKAAATRQPARAPRSRATAPAQRAPKAARRTTRPAPATAASRTPFDPGAYVRMPRLDVPAAVGLAAQVMAAAPRKPPPSVARALAEVGAAHQQLNTLWVKRNRAGRAADPRPIDNRADSAWAGFFDRLENYTRMPADEYPNAARAAELLSLLFPERVAFIRQDYTSQWAEMNKILHIIEQDRLDAELETLVGADFLHWVRAVHGPYGAMVGATAPRREATAQESLVEPLARLVDSLVAYGTQLVALYYDGDDATRTAVRQALQPIDDLRAATRRSGAADAAKGRTPAGEGTGGGGAGGDADDAGAGGGDADEDAAGEDA